MQARFTSKIRIRPSAKWEKTARPATKTEDSEEKRRKHTRKNQTTFLQENFLRKKKIKFLKNRKTTIVISNMFRKSINLSSKYVLYSWISDFDLECLQNLSRLKKHAKRHAKFLKRQNFYKNLRIWQNFAVAYSTSMKNNLLYPLDILTLK